MKLQVEVAILEKSVLIGLIENSIEEYMKIAKGNILDKKDALRVIGAELERVKELNLVSFYGISSLVSLEVPLKEKADE